MTDYIAFEAPAWLWCLACMALLVAGVAFGALAAYVLRIRQALDRIDDYEALAAPRADVQRAFAKVDERLSRLEKPEPLRVESVAPLTIQDDEPPTRTILPPPPHDPLDTTLVSAA